MNRYFVFIDNESASPVAVLQSREEVAILHLSYLSPRFVAARVTAENPADAIAEAIAFVRPHIDKKATADMYRGKIVEIDSSLRVAIDNPSEDVIPFSDES